jgi:hypothetical protein
MIHDREHGFPTTPMNYAKIEKFAISVRAVLLPTTALSDEVPGITVFEDMHELEIESDGRTFNVNYAVNALPAGIEGISSYDPDRDEILLTLAPATYSSLSAGIPRALFSLAHEIGHVCVHTAKLVELSSIPHKVAALNRGQTPAHRAFEDTEWQANAFAAAFLMPAAGLEELESRGIVVTPKELVRRFNVSFDAARIRLDVYRAHRNDLLFRSKTPNWQQTGRANNLVRKSSL